MYCHISIEAALQERGHLCDVQGGVSVATHLCMPSDMQSIEIVLTRVSEYLNY